MRIPRLYLDCALQVGEILTLPEMAHRHAVQVLRLKPGAELCVFNGQGGQYNAHLLEVTRRQSQVRILGFTPLDTLPRLPITLAQGIAKGERMDYALQKAVELGVSAVQPLFTQRTVQLDDPKRLNNRLHHWRGVIISACEQCGRVELPTLYPPQRLDQWLDAAPLANDLGIVLSPQAEHSLAQLAYTPNAVTVLIGPEGGLEERELRHAQAKGFHAVRLGPRILRTETAALAALSLIQARFGDLGE
ncbi:16S rRNA (uracil(1498)-N(3))-methyltransferase [Thiorhodospira sibirica]|uniref:16S rRNA (uracil(1498)-N(3))-methyltransferase n=1 Tax=Thiorhodospira sibirica TaxID=154347 RepID=UPI00022C0B21|nr:16S rRNA (uracil(1498)-N(3))-methyltransferase [Thiorhodospira sibirica]